MEDKSGGRYWFSQMLTNTKMETKQSDKLAILEHSDDLLNKSADKITPGKVDLEYIDGSIKATSCFRIPQEENSRNGDISIQSKKRMGYHLAAFLLFGREKLEKVSSGKTEEDALTISHLCGTRRCLNLDHLILELKRINDERTHCHFAISNVKEKSGWQGVKTLLDCGACPHTPKCAQP